MLKKCIFLFGILVTVCIIITGCQPTPVVETQTITIVETVIVEKEGEKIIETIIIEPDVEKNDEVENLTKQIDRTGSYLDTIIFVEERSCQAAISRLQSGDIDVYAYNITSSESDCAETIFAAPDLTYETTYVGNYYDLIFMPSSSPEFSDGRLNPFFSEKIREAMNWLIDRNHIVDEISGGLAVPRVVPINYASKDAAILADTIAALDMKYAYNPAKAVQIIDTEMEALGAQKEDNGKWLYKDEPVILVGLIRTEDEYLAIGEYISFLLEEIGFTVQRDYKTSAESSPCRLRSDPDDGCAHFYTSNWISTGISRDESSNFSLFYTPDGLPFPPWQAYSPSKPFLNVSTRLANSEFFTLEERTDLMRTAMIESLLDSQHIWLKEDIALVPHTKNISLASDLSGSVYGSWLWSETIKYADQIGGSMTIAMPIIVIEPWNPIGGTNWVYDMMPIRGMNAPAVVQDPFTGLSLPYLLDSATVYIEEGLPVEQNLDWMNLEYVPVGSIRVPDDAWADWDANARVFIPASERFPEGTSALSKVVMTYESDYFEKMKWHDGSPITLADHIMFAIMQFDPSKEESPIYDETTVPAFETFMKTFKGWKIISEDPLTVEYYTDDYSLDAENNVSNLRAMHSSASQDGEYGWHALVPGWMAEANGEAAFTPDKAEDLGVEWMSWISGPTLDIMKSNLDIAQAQVFIPYEPTLGQYISVEEAEIRYANLQEWFRRYNHFWVNSGPMYLQKAFPVEGTLILHYNPGYPYAADRWDSYASNPIPDVFLDGEYRVTMGEAAVYDVYVDLAGAPYFADDISMVKYLVFDTTNELVLTGDAEFIEDGYYTVTLGADVTSRLVEGNNQLAVVVVSKRTLVPMRDTLQFVTIP